MKKNLRKMCPESIYRIYGKTKFYLRFHLARKGLISEMFRGLLGYEMDWNNPKDINEKINWMKMYYDTSEWSVLADKFRVRKYVEERVGENILTQLYGVWENADDIDFDSLPNKFVLKTNHGAGTVIPVIEKNELDISETKNILNEWLKIRYGYSTIEPHYLKIKPLIIAEEYLENNDNFSSAIVDYKVFCLSGKPYCILVCTNRVQRKHTDLSFYDCEWNYIDDILDGNHKGEGPKIPKPECLSTLLRYAEKLATGHPQVRVDFYIVSGKIYFGEMTFTSQGGYMDYISRKYSTIMGEKININDINR